MKCGTDIHGAQKMKSNNFGGPPTWVSLVVNTEMSEQQSFSPQDEL